jgi:hypothetical protein
MKHAFASLCAGKICDMVSSMPAMEVLFLAKQYLLNSPHPPTVGYVHIGSYSSNPVEFLARPCCKHAGICSNL